MVYYKRKYRPRRRYVKKPKAKTAVDKAQNRKLSRITRMINTEDRWANYVLNLTSVDNVGTVYAISMPSQGDTYNARQGDSISWLSITGKVSAIHGDTTNLVRFIIFQWIPDNNIDAPSVLKILQTSSPMSMYVGTKNQRAKFRVLKDVLHNVSAQGSPQTLHRVAISGSKMFATKFNAAATTGKGIPYILVISDSGAATHPTISTDLKYSWFG